MKKNDYEMIFTSESAKFLVLKLLSVFLILQTITNQIQIFVLEINFVWYKFV